MKKRAQCPIRPRYPDHKCGCWFCANNSNGIGVIIAPADHNQWYVMFDIGEYPMLAHEVETISEAAREEWWK